ncbi:hypothetical protein LRP67_15230 [Nocardioides sp. cx-169]|uniref:hypothetical protein n=1 Tax=Nocardioides sp. cx-169 TaxID=2899080 RepID=UPI001E535769|nr:hypothetical protein [Nocardioides sp. cx-169]MCD4535444.1 hypothetical protein [Nocardioides sp. cx-169]
MTPDQPQQDDQLIRLMERAMLPVTASEELVAGGLTRGRRLTRRRRTAQAAGIGAAALAAVAALAAPSFLGDRDDQPPSAASVPDDGASGPADGQTQEPTSAPSADQLPPHLQRAQQLLLEALPDDIPSPGYSLAGVEYDPDGRGLGEIRQWVTIDDSGIVGGQAARCDRVAASPAPDDCVATEAGWVFTGPSLPDVSGKHPDLAGMQAIYILRDGKIVHLIAYNALEAALGGEPTRTDPVLDADELVELVTKTDWFD